MRGAVRGRAEKKEEMADQKRGVWSSPSLSRGNCTFASMTAEYLKKRDLGGMLGEGITDLDVTWKKNSLVKAGGGVGRVRGSSASM